MLVFEGFEDNEFSILDTEDGIIEQISGEDLLNALCTSDIEIQGLSLNNKGFIVNDAKTVLYKPARNSNLNRAKKAKNDEFYTQLSDIEKELSHYPIETFKDKVIYCPCDIPSVSEFWNYFHINFKKLGIKKLIATFKNWGSDKTYGSCYLGGSDSDIASRIDFYYDGDGDFRSEYCTRLLQEADIVVTNPPFSLFRDVLKWIMSANKKFLIIGNQNAFTYKEVFPLIKDGKIWLGSQKGVNNDQYFEMDKSYLLSENVRAQVEKKFSKEFLKDHNMTRLPGCCWFTNCNHDTRFDKMVLLTKQDNENTGYTYEKYDNYDAIEVSRVSKIPSDYDGVMGVPITFLYQYNPEQFEIVNMKANQGFKDRGTSGLIRGLLNGRVTYARILIRRKNK